MEDPSSASATAGRLAHRCTPRSASENVVRRVRRGECAVRDVIFRCLSSNVGNRPGVG